MVMVDGEDIKKTLLINMKVITIKIKSMGKVFSLGHLEIYIKELTNLTNEKEKV
jgi:hypothetical protein